MPSTLISSGSKKKEPRYVCLSEARASHSHKIWTEVSSVPHFLQMGLLLSLIMHRCLLKVCLVSRPTTTLDCVLLKDNVACSQRSIPGPVSVYYKDYATVPDAVSSSSISSLFLYSAQRPPGRARVQQTTEPNHSLQAHQQFHFLSLWHAQGPNITPQHAGQRCHSTPAGTVVPKEMLFQQPEALSEPPDYQSKILVYFSGRT